MLNSTSDVAFRLRKKRVKWTARWSYQEDGKNVIIYSFWKIFLQNEIVGRLLYLC